MNILFTLKFKCCLVEDIKCPHLLLTQSRLTFFTSSVLDSLLNSLENLPVIWQVEGLKNEWEWCIISAHSLDRCLEVVERALLNCCSKFGAKTTSDRGFVSDNAFTSLFDRVHHCFTVPGQDCAQINDLT